MTEPGMSTAARLAIAALVGLAAGLEREWSGHTSGPNARFAGIRTFFILGLLGGIIGTLDDASHGNVAAALGLGAALLSAGAYVMTVRRPGTETDGTTEAAALVVVALGVLAGIGMIGVAAGAGAVVVLMLSEKARLHWLVRQLGEPELRAGLQFAVLAVVVLPLLPSGPFFGALGVKPRALWTIVLLFSGLNFAGFIARRIFGTDRGLSITGALGGVISSTAVVLAFSRQSRLDSRFGGALARGAIAACTVLVPRILVVSAALSPAVALELLPMLLPALFVGLVALALMSRAKEPPSEAVPVDDTNPLRLGAAVRMAVAFQVAMLLIVVARNAWGGVGLRATAAFLGLTDVDALTVSMSRVEANIAPAAAAYAIAIGILANTALKLVISIALGRASYRRRAAAGLVGLAAASVAGMLLV
jgi:uncharacterized membrane protein (DUF4010 family)